MIIIYSEQPDAPIIKLKCPIQSAIHINNAPNIIVDRMTTPWDIHKYNKPYTYEPIICKNTFAAMKYFYRLNLKPHHQSWYEFAFRANHIRIVRLIWHAEMFILLPFYIGNMYAIREYDGRIYFIMLLMLLIIHIFMTIATTIGYYLWTIIHTTIKRNRIMRYPNGKEMLESLGY